MKSSLAPLQFSLLTIRASDLERSARFYAALGLEFHRHRHGAGAVHLSADCDGLVFEIYPDHPPDPPTRSTRLGFRVADLEAATQRLIAAGGRLVSRPSGAEWGERSVIADPDGHRVELLATSP